MSNGTVPPAVVWVDLLITVATNQLPELIRWFRSRGQEKSAQQLMQMLTHTIQVDEQIMAECKKAAEEQGVHVPATPDPGGGYGI